MWAVFAISASLFWGIAYALDEQIFKHISFYTSFAIATALACLIFAGAALVTGTLQKDLAVLTSNREVLWLALASSAAFLIAHVFLGLAIVGKNATLTALIEISYPLFIILVTYFVFKESHLSVWTILGGVLIASGVAVIYIFNR